MICLLDYLNAYLLGFLKPDDSGFKYFIYLDDLGTRFLSSRFPLVTSSRCFGQELICFRYLLFLPQTIGINLTEIFQRGWFNHHLVSEC